MGLSTSSREETGHVLPVELRAQQRGKWSNLPQTRTSSPTAGPKTIPPSCTTNGGTYKKRKGGVEKSVCFKYFALGRSIKTFCPVIRKHFLLNRSPSLLGSWRKTQHFIKRQPLDVLSEMSTRLFLTQQGAA